MKPFFFLAGVMASLMMCLNACGNPPSKPSTSEGSAFVVDGVNEYAFDFTEHERGAMISFHSNELQKCSLSFAAKNFVAGFKATSTVLGGGDVDLMCLSDKGNYILSKSEPTLVKVEIVATQPAQLRIQFNLYNPRGKDWQKAEAFLLQLTLQQSKTLRTSN